MEKSRLVSTMISGLLLVILADAAMAQSCSQVFGGTDQDKLIQNLSRCAQDVRATTSYSQYTAYLDPESCRIRVRTAQGDFYNRGTLQLIECMSQYGWKIPFTSCDINGY
ncbi:MAG TPA: hypothetical protein VFG19_11575 [Geobacteraceae bacterium]|nr:hypothetical protein [Geobacteraceae bacterium]